MIKSTGIKKSFWGLQRCRPFYCTNLIPKSTGYFKNFQGISRWIFRVFQGIGTILAVLKNHKIQWQLKNFRVFQGIFGVKYPEKMANTLFQKNLGYRKNPVFIRLSGTFLYKIPSIPKNKIIGIYTRAYAHTRIPYKNFIGYSGYRGIFKVEVCWRSWTFWLLKDMIATKAWRADFPWWGPSLSGADNYWCEWLSSAAVLLKIWNLVLHFCGDGYIIQSS